MQIEYEVVFWPVDHDSIRAKLQGYGAEIVRKEFTQQRYNFATPHNNPHEWLRLRTTGPRTTLALKRKEGEGMKSQQELEIDVLDFERAVELLRESGLKEISYQEAKREIYHLDGCDIDLDTWPYLDPILKIEGVAEEPIRACAEKLGMNWAEARFETIAELYQEKYGKKDEHLVVENASRITFDDPNPFV